MSDKKDILAVLGPAEAVAVLRHLAKDPQTRKRAEDIAQVKKLMDSLLRKSA